MAPSSAAMELKVLINILTQGTALPTLLAQTKQLSAALSQLQMQANAGAGAGAGFAGVAAGANAATTAVTGAGTASAAAGKAAATGATGFMTIEQAMNKALYAARFLAGGFLTLQSVRFLKSMADDAARAQVLSTVLRVVAENSGYTADQIDRVDTSVQRLGITAESSRKSLTQFLQAGLKLEFAPKLARAAQDLAVISGMDSSSTFARLIINIQQLDTMGLRFMGIVTDRQLANQKYKQSHQEITGALSKRQEQEALLLEVLEKAKQLEGVYATSMNDVGKQLTSLTRLNTTLSQTMGDALLPAYSGIVREVSLLYEKLILLAKEFSTDTARSQAWADAAIALTKGLSSLILTIAEHIDQIVGLLTLYATWKVSALAISAVFTAATGIASFIGWLARLRAILLLSRTATISFTVAMQALNAASVKDAISLIAVANAQTAVAATAPAAAAGVASVGTAAQVTTTSVLGLATAWGTLIAALAVPAVVIGGAIALAVQKDKEFEQQSTLERGRRARAEPLSGEFSRLTGEAALGGEASQAGAGQGDSAFTKVFEEWKRENPALVEGLRTDNALLAEFNRQLDAMDKSTALTGFSKDLADANVEVKAAILAQYELKQAAKEAGSEIIPAEFQAAADRIAAATKRVSEIRAQMTKAFEGTALPTSVAEIGKQMDKVSAMEAKLPKTPGGRGAVAAAEAELALEKAKRDVMVAQFETRLKMADQTDAQVKKDKIALAAFKADIEAAAKSAESFQQAMKEVFGEKQFLDEGITTEGFNKAFGLFDQASAQATREAAETTAGVTQRTVRVISEAITAMGQAVKTPLDLSKLKGLREEIEKLPKAIKPEALRMLQQAIGLGEIGARQTRLSVRAPLVTERLDAIAREADARIEAERLVQTKQKTSNAAENIELEKKYKQGLVLLDEYYRQRITRVEEEGRTELRVQEEQIAKLQAQQKAAEDPKQKAQLGLQVTAAQNQIPAIAGRTELEIMRLITSRQERRIQLDRELEQGLLAQAAIAGGLEAQLQKINFEIEQERRKFAEAGDPLADQLLRLKQLSAEAEVYRKAREEAYAVEQRMSQILEEELNLAQTQRGVEATRDQAARQRGEISSAELTRRNNSRAEDAMADNRVLKAQKELDLARLKNRQANELLRLQGELEEQEVSAAEIERRRTAQFQQNTLEIKAAEQAIAGYDQAYAELGMTIELTSQKIRQSFEDSFASAITQSIVDFRRAGEVWKGMATSIASEIVGIFSKKISEGIASRLDFGWLDTLLGGKKPGPTRAIPNVSGLGLGFAQGGLVTGPGSGTSDSIPAMLSAGEHVMPAEKAAKYMPLLEGIRKGTIRPAFALGGEVSLQSIAPTVIPRRYATGGVVVMDGGASSVQSVGGKGNLQVSLHPDALNMTMSDWLEREVARQQGRR